MTYLTLDKEAIRGIKMQMLELMIKKTKNYRGDLIVDFDKLERLNNEGKLESKMYFITRVHGTEFGTKKDDRIQYFRDRLAKAINTDEENICYEINIEAIYKYCEDQKEKKYSISCYDDIYEKSFKFITEIE